ncbi:transglycosylase SLT domain-containing protein [Klebsiella pneumoniae]|uniref:transglycosylase SLT domain-containing protein n=1 Tax=Klebsiella pneumoniae TaxID=573 RepID=UPI001F060047|nr:transglycosylase SLT domain-containing protein [Klebsiella pneumoniae]MCH0727170.1 transglycosylase SLT domain-containing protein [Klebsiella pneumoniae]
MSVKGYAFLQRQNNIEIISLKQLKKYAFQPEGLSALIYAESRWKANATNPTGSGAVGLGQFKPDTWLSLCAESESKIYQLITGKYSYQKLVYKNRKFLVNWSMEL